MTVVDGPKYYDYTQDIIIIIVSLLSSPLVNCRPFTVNKLLLYNGCYDFAQSIIPKMFLKRILIKICIFGTHVGASIFSGNWLTW